MRVKIKFRLFDYLNYNEVKMLFKKKQRPTKIRSCFRIQQSYTHFDLNNPRRAKNFQCHDYRLVFLKSWRRHAVILARKEKKRKQ